MTKAIFRSKLFNKSLVNRKKNIFSLNKYNIKLDKQWVAASRTRNAALNDHCLDYFKIYNINKLGDIPRKGIYKRVVRRNSRDNFTNHILTNGIKFEDKIYYELCDKFNDNVIKIGDSYQADSYELFQLTFEEMRKGTPIIYQGILHNPDNKTFGSCDLIVRSDWINKLIEIPVINNDIANEAAKHLSGSYHYRVIDIKNTKLHFNADFQTIRNMYNVKPYKCQLLIYNYALAVLQGYYPSEAYILANGWKYQSKGKSLNNDCPFNRLGIVSYENKDKQYYQITEQAVLWYRDLLISEDWKYDPPSRHEIYPNMSNRYDDGYHYLKSGLANKLGDITQLWNCGPKQRELAFENEIYSWRDSRCNAELLGFKGKTAKILDTILLCNRDPSVNVYPLKIKNNLNNWKSKNNLELFVDFEIINEYLNNEEFIFMIGLGWCVNQEWFYIDFTMNKLNKEEEYRVITEFIEKINLLKELYGEDNPNIYHWNFTEKVAIEKAIKRHNIEEELNWLDFLEVVREEPICVKGSLTFSLKDFAKAMFQLNLIQTVWENGEISNGLEAMYKAWKIYHKTVKTPEDKLTMEMIKKYNEIDCKVIYEIVNYLRENH